MNKVIKKTYDIKLLVDFRTGKAKVISRPRKIGAYEIPIDLKLNMVIPEDPKIKIEGTITIPENKVEAMSMEYFDSDEKEAK